MTHECRGRDSNLVHVINHFFTDIGNEIEDIPPEDDIWNRLSKEELVKRIRYDVASWNDEIEKIWISTSEALDAGGNLGRTVHLPTVIEKHSTYLLPLFLHYGTAATEDMRDALFAYAYKFCGVDTENTRKYNTLVDRIEGVPKKQRYLILTGDEQTCGRVSALKSMYPLEFGNMIAVPGLFHMYWHILRAIMKLFGPWFIVPLAQVFGHWRVSSDTKDFFLQTDEWGLQVLFFIIVYDF